MKAAEKKDTLEVTCRLFLWLGRSTSPDQNVRRVSFDSVPGIAFS
jgi:hypothetical protein